MLNTITMYALLLHVLVLALPGIIIAIGMLATIPMGKRGLARRKSIARALDRVGAAILWGKDKNTISGYVGLKVKSSKHPFIWRMWGFLIDILPGFYLGHCADQAIQEAAIA